MMKLARTDRRNGLTWFKIARAGRRFLSVRSSAHGRAREGAMKRSGSRKNDESDDRGAPWDDDIPTHAGPDGDPRSTMSAKERAAHDRGTRRARITLVALVVFCCLLKLTRPLYGPYIDRFGVNNDQSMMERFGSHLEERARRNNLDLNPRPWDTSRTRMKTRQKRGGGLREREGRRRSDFVT